MYMIKGYIHQFVSPVEGLWLLSHRHIYRYHLLITRFHWNVRMRAHAHVYVSNSILLRFRQCC